MELRSRASGTQSRRTFNINQTTVNMNAARLQSIWNKFGARDDVDAKQLLHLLQTMSSKDGDNGGVSEYMS